VTYLGPQVGMFAAGFHSFGTVKILAPTISIAI